MLEWPLRERRIVVLPGQYYDDETGLYYNYFRDYDPVTGRYVESDLIGLGGGLNTFGYVGGNPLNSIDILGLEIYRFPENVYTDTPFSISASTGCEQPLWAGDFIVGWIPCTYNRTAVLPEDCPPDAEMSNNTTARHGCRFCIENRRHHPSLGRGESYFIKEGGCVTCSRRWC